MKNNNHIAHDRLDIISYAFAVMAGLCFASGVVVLSGGKGH